MLTQKKTIKKKTNKKNKNTFYRNILLLIYFAVAGMAYSVVSVLFFWVCDFVFCGLMSLVWGELRGIKKKKQRNYKKKNISIICVLC